MATLSTRPRIQLPANGGIVDSTNTNAMPPISPLPDTGIIAKTIKNKRPSTTTATNQNPTTVPANTAANSTPLSNLSTPASISGTGTYNPAQITDTSKWVITPDQTVQGQLAGILAKNSPLQQQAATTSLQQSNARGLLNSGMAVGNAESAVIQSALPIATSDADVNARSAGYNADELNKMAVENMSASNAASQFGAGSKLTQSENKLAREQQTALQNSQQTWQGGQNEADRALQVQQDTFNANVQASIAQINNDAQGDRNQQSIYGNLGATTMQQITAIQTDVNLNQATKQYMYEQLMANYKAQVGLIASVGQVPNVATLINFNQQPTYSSADINNWLAQHADASDAQIAAAMVQYNISPQQMSEATGLPLSQIQARMAAAGY